MNSAHGPCACAARSRSNATSCSAWWHSRSIKYSASRSSGPRRPERRPLQPREHRENSPRSMNFARASFDYVHGLRQKGQKEHPSKVLLVEFKKPGRKNYPDSENPQLQVERYVRELQSGNLTDVRGRPIQLD